MGVALPCASSVSLLLKNCGRRPQTPQTRLLYSETRTHQHLLPQLQRNQKTQSNSDILFSANVYLDKVTLVLEYDCETMDYNKRGSKMWTTGCAVALSSEHMDFDWVGCKLVKLVDSVTSVFRVVWLSESGWRFLLVCAVCGTDASFDDDDDVCVWRFLFGLWPLRRDAIERFGRGFFWNTIKADYIN